MKNIKKSISVLLMISAVMVSVMGCAKTAEEVPGDDTLSDNIIITETGEIIQKYPQPAQEAEPTAEPALEELPDSEAKDEVKDEVTPEKTEAPETSQETENNKDTENGQGEEAQTQEQPVDNSLQIVFMGDSIFDGHRDGTGVPYLTAVQCEANLYNLAIGGTSAAVGRNESVHHEDWDSQSLAGIVKAIEGDISTDAFEGTKVKAILDDKSIDWSNTDYFIIEYGINDFLSTVPFSNEDNKFDLRTYTGALRYAVTNLCEVAPDATIILCCPHYAQFFDGNRFIGDGNSLNNGYGTLFDYKGKCQYIANEQGVYQFDAYMDLGIDGYTAKDYLEDGIHLTSEGRQLYADALARKILSIERTKNN